MPANRQADLPQITSLSWALDGSYLAVGNEDGNVEIWDVDTSKRMRNMTGHMVSLVICHCFAFIDK
jgi:WD40 repeat protein